MGFQNYMNSFVEFINRIHSTENIRIIKNEMNFSIYLYFFRKYFKIIIMWKYKLQWENDVNSDDYDDDDNDNNHNSDDKDNLIMIAMIMMIVNNDS